MRKGQMEKTSKLKFYWEDEEEHHGSSPMGMLNDEEAKIHEPKRGNYHERPDQIH